jgi:hypothetical protein
MKNLKTGVPVFADSVPIQKWKIVLLNRYPQNHKSDIFLQLSLRE